MARPVIPQYYVGAFGLGRTPDFDRVAKTIDLLRANDVGIVTVPSVIREDGEVYLPFFTRSLQAAPLPLLDNERVDPRPLIESLSGYRLKSYAKLDPATANDLALDALVRLSKESRLLEGERPTRAEDLRPRSAPLAKEDAFEGLVGLRAQQATLLKIANLVAKHGRDVIGSLHMAFLGNPGTGKTELARRLLAHCDAHGITSGGGVFVQVAAADLIGRFVGSTPTRVREAVERARGGILFIDEAYALADTTAYGQEAIDTLVEELESGRGSFICVAAGYRDQMERLFDGNPGLRDRFGFRIRFDDYSVEELVRLFELFAHKGGFRVDPHAVVELQWCARQLRALRGFANARSMRRLFDRAAMEAATHTDEAIICARDVRRAFEQDDMGRDAALSPVGFA